MFIVENSSIINEKTLEVGQTLKENVIFDFTDVEFTETDTFELSIANETSSLYGFTEEGYLRFTLFNFDWIEDEETSASISVTKNGVEILSDTIVIEAQQGGGSGGSSSMVINDVETLTGIVPKENNVYRKTLAANDSVSFVVSGDKPINFELWLNMASVVSFTFSNSILWCKVDVVDSSNLPPLFNQANTLYVVACRYDGTNVIANLAYKKQ